MTELYPVLEVGTQRRLEKMRQQKNGYDKVRSLDFILYSMMANQLAVNRKRVTIRNALQKKHNGISMKERLEWEGRD